MWSRREYHRAERAQPVVGILLLTATAVWMAKNEPEGVGAFFVALVFGWSILLILRYTAMSLMRIVRLAGPYFRNPMDQVFTFHDYGCSMRIDDSRTWHYRWDNLKDIVFGNSGIGIRCMNSDAGSAIEYLYVARASFAPRSQEYQELEAFLRSLQDSLHARAELTQ